MDTKTAKTAKPSLQSYVFGSSNVKAPPTPFFRLKYDHQTIQGTKSTTNHHIARAYVGNGYTDVIAPLSTIPVRSASTVKENIASGEKTVDSAQTDTITTEKPQTVMAYTGKSYTVVPNKLAPIRLEPLTRSTVRVPIQLESPTRSTVHVPIQLEPLTASTVRIPIQSESPTTSVNANTQNTLRLNSASNTSDFKSTNYSSTKHKLTKIQLPTNFQTATPYNLAVHKIREQNIRPSTQCTTKLSKTLPCSRSHNVISTHPTDAVNYTVQPQQHNNTFVSKVTQTTKNGSTQEPSFW